MYVIITNHKYAIDNSVFVAHQISSEVQRVYYHPHRRTTDSVIVPYQPKRATSVNGRRPLLPKISAATDGLGSGLTFFFQQLVDCRGDTFIEVMRHLIVILDVYLKVVKKIINWRLTHFLYLTAIRNLSVFIPKDFDLRTIYSRISRLEVIGTFLNRVLSTKRVSPGIIGQSFTVSYCGPSSR